MKTKLFFIAFFLFLFSNSVSAQYYDNYGGGVDRSIGQQARENKPRKKTTEKKDFGEGWANHLNKQLKLDALQYAAVKSIMNDNKDSLEEISKSEEMRVEEKKDKIQEIMDKIDIQILKLLSKDQAEKYLKLKEDRQKKALTQ